MLEAGDQKSRDWIIDFVKHLGISKEDLTKDLEKDRDLLIPRNKKADDKTIELLYELKLARVGQGRNMHEIYKELAWPRFENNKLIWTDFGGPVCDVLIDLIRSTNDKYLFKKYFFLLRNHYSPKKDKFMKELISANYPDRKWYAIEALNAI